MALSIPVIDFRRQSMVLAWDPEGGAWSAYDVPPALVHGVALIRATQPNICVFAQGDRLQIQVGAEIFALGADSPSLNWNRGLAGLGPRRRFTIETRDGEKLLSQEWWDGKGDDFFSWLVAHAADPGWRASSRHRWSEGIEPAVLRAN